MRMRVPKVTILIFASGKKILCTRAKSEIESKRGARKCASYIQQLGFRAMFKDFKILNIVASYDVKFAIRLEAFACGKSEFVSYEPDLFPGLTYHMEEPKVTLLVFASGKVVITGAKCKEDIDEAFELIYPSLGEFKKLT